MSLEAKRRMLSSHCQVIEIISTNIPDVRFNKAGPNSFLQNVLTAMFVHGMNHHFVEGLAMVDILYPCSYNMYCVEQNVALLLSCT